MKSRHLKGEQTLGSEQAKAFEQTVKALDRSSQLLLAYWQQYSNMTTWQFWFLLALLIIPLIALYLFIDRKKSLLIGFFGFNINIWFHYADLYTSTHGQTSFPYKIIPFLPVSVTLDVSFVPVAFMLVYQWTLNYKKNFYLYATALSFGFAFLFKPALVTFGLFRISKGMNYFYIFLLFVLIAFVSKWITNFFLYLQKNGESPIHIIKSGRFFTKKQKAR